MLRCKISGGRQGRRSNSIFGYRNVDVQVVCGRSVFELHDILCEFRSTIHLSDFGRLSCIYFGKGAVYIVSTTFVDD